MVDKNKDAAEDHRTASLGKASHNGTYMMYISEVSVVWAKMNAAVIQYSHDRNRCGVYRELACGGALFWGVAAQGSQGNPHSDTHRHSHVLAEDLCLYEPSAVGPELSRALARFIMMPDTINHTVTTYYCP